MPPYRRSRGTRSTKEKGTEIERVDKYPVMWYDREGTLAVKLYKYDREVVDFMGVCISYTVDKRLNHVHGLVEHRLHLSIGTTTNGTQM